MAILARRRLKQASYFLEQAETTVLDRDIFAANLEAFLAFGRSAADILGREVGQAGANTRACFERTRDALAKEPLRSMGNMVLHEGKDSARAEHELVASEGLYVVSGFSIEAFITRADGTTEIAERQSEIPKPIATKVPTANATKVERSVRYFFTKGPLRDQEVLAQCRDYLQRLEQAIIEAERCGA